MKRTFFLTLAALMLALVVCPLLNGQSTPVPNFLTYQGRLTTPAGAPVPDGNYPIRFSIHNDPVNANFEWQHTIDPVPVVKGLFSVTLPGITPAVLQGSRYLEIKVGDDAPLSPRTRLGSVPYAIKADQIKDGGIVATSLANGAVTSAAILDGAVANNDLATDPVSFQRVTGAFASYSDSKFTFNPSASLGIGISPAVQFHVRGHARIDEGELQSWGPLIFHPDTDQSGDDVVRFLNSAGAENLRVHSNGFLGIGNTSPEAPIHVTDNRTFSVPTMWLNAASTIGTWILLNNLANGGRNWGLISTGPDNGEGAGKFMIRDQTGFANRLVIDSSGRVGINTHSPSFSLHVAGSLAATVLPFGDYRNVQWNDATGQFYYDNSSRRHKENITPLQDTFSNLLKAQPKTYTRPGVPNRWEIGYIAEDFDALGLKKLVDYEQDGVTPAGINYEKLGLYLVEIAKSQEQQLESLRQKADQVETLRAENDALRSQLNHILQRLEKLEAASPQLPSPPTSPASRVAAN